MATRPLMLLAPVLGLVLAFVAPDQPREMAETRRGRGAATAATNSYGAWGNRFRLEKHMTAARDWAGEALKRGRQRLVFTQDPVAVVGDPDDVAKVIERDWAKALALLGAKDLAARAALARHIAGHVLAVYDPATGVIHVLPENARRAAEAAGDSQLMSEDVLRLLLVRMAIVALMREHYPEWKTALDGAEDLDALRTAAAVFQGRVQYQTRRVAGVMNQQDSGFSLGSADDLVTLLTAPVAEDADPGLKAFAEAARFAVLKGENFMANVPRTFHDKLIREPPTQANVIFDPKTYVEDLRAAAKRGPVEKLPGTVHSAFVNSFMTDGAWKHVAGDLDAARVEAMLAPLEKRFYATAMASFRQGWSYTSAPGADGSDEGPKTDVHLIEMRTDGQAEGLLNLLRGAGKDRGATYEDGAGRDLGLNGFHGTETIDGVTYHVQWAAEGRFVVGFRTTHDLSDDTKREPWDEVMEGVAEDVAKVAGSRDSRRRRRGR